jgi:hypothetical protein
MSRLEFGDDFGERVGPFGLEHVDGEGQPLDGDVGAVVVVLLPC